MTKEELERAWARRINMEKTAEILKRGGRRVRNTDARLNPKSPNEARRAAEALEQRRSGPKRSFNPKVVQPRPITPKLLDLSAEVHNELQAVEDRAHARNLAANRAMMEQYKTIKAPTPKGGVVTKVLSQPTVVKAVDAVGRGLTTAANSGVGRAVAKIAGSTGARVAAKVAGRVLLPLGVAADLVAIGQAANEGAKAFSSKKDAIKNEIAMTEQYGSVAAATRTRHAREAAKKKS